MKKVLSFILVLSMVLGSFGMTFAAPASDIAGHQNETAILRLNKLGIVTGYENGDFRPDANITRAEFAVLLVRALGLEGAASARKGDTQFTDVTVAAGYEWASGAINVATGLGHIQGYGNGKFGPADQITYQDAITLVVRALGYETKAKELGGYPTGHFIVADRDLELTDDIKNVALGVAATRGTVFQLLDNALTVDMMEQVYVGDVLRWTVVDKTLLSVLGYEKVEGRVIEVDTKDNEIVLRDETAKKASDWKNLGALTIAEGLDFEAVLGLKIKAWYDEDNDTVISWETKEEALFDALGFDEKDEEITLVGAKADYELHEEAIVYVNGKTGRNVELEDIDYDYAKVVLDGKKAIFVSAYTWDNFIVVEKTEDDVVYGYGDEVDVEDFTIVKGGKTITLEDLEEKDVLFYNRDAEYAEVYNKTVTGKIDRILADRVRVAGTAYAFANSYLGVNARYIDENGDIADLLVNENLTKDVLEAMEEEEVAVLLDRNGAMVFISGDLSTLAVSSNYYMVVADSVKYDTRGKKKWTLDVANAEGKKVSFDVDDSALLPADATKTIFRNPNGTAATWVVTPAGDRTSSIKIEDVLEIKVDADGDIDEIKLVDAHSVSSKFEVKNKYVSAKRINENALVFLAEKFTSSKKVADLKTSTYGDLKFEYIDNAEFYYDKEDKVVAIVVTNSSRESDATTHESIVSAAVRKVSGKNIWEVQVIIDGEKVTFDTKEQAANSFTTDITNVKKGDLVRVDINDATKLIDDIEVIGSGASYKAGAISDLNISRRTFKIGSYTIELAKEGFVVDATASNYKVVNFNTLNNGDVVNVLLVEDNARFTEIIVITDEARTQAQIVEDATDAVKVLEATDASALVQADINAAQADINLINNAATKNALQARLNAVQKALDAVGASTTYVVKEYRAAFKAFRLENIDGTVSTFELANYDLFLDGTAVTADEMHAWLATSPAVVGVTVEVTGDELDVLSATGLTWVENQRDVVAVAAAKTALDLGDLTAITADITLPTAGVEGTTIAWASSDVAVVDTDGTVVRPTTGNPDATVTLTATITKGAASDTKVFTATVVAE